MGMVGKVRLPKTAQSVLEHVAFTANRAIKQEEPGQGKIPRRGLLETARMDERTYREIGKSLSTLPVAIQSEEKQARSLRAFQEWISAGIKVKADPIHSGEIYQQLWMSLAGACAGAAAGGGEGQGLQGFTGSPYRVDLTLDRLSAIGEGQLRGSMSCLAKNSQPSEAAFAAIVRLGEIGFSQAGEILAEMTVPAKTPDSLRQDALRVCRSWIQTSVQAAKQDLDPEKAVLYLNFWELLSALKRDVKPAGLIGVRGSSPGEGLQST